MNLYIDLGNTCTKFAIDKEDSVSLELLFKTNLMKENKTNILDFVSKNNIDKVFIASVVPNACKTLIKILKKKVCSENIKEISPLEEVNFKVNIDDRNELGTDLLCDLAAANELYKKPLVIIDCGTATKALYISKDSEFFCCVIVPGLRISIDSLSNKTAMLDKFTVEEPKPYFDCHNTKDVLNSSIIFGQVDMIHGIIDRYTEQIGCKPNVIVTGGYSKYLSKYFDFKYISEPNLSLIGLKEICRKK